MSKTTREYKAEYIRGQVKALAALKGHNLNTLLHKLHTDYGWTMTQSNFSNRLKKGTFNSIELQEILESINFKIKFVEYNAD